jgi:hypothetical protein
MVTMVQLGAQKKNQVTDTCMYPVVGALLFVLLLYFVQVLNTFSTAHNPESLQ